MRQREGGGGGGINIIISYNERIVFLTDPARLSSQVMARDKEWRAAGGGGGSLDRSLARLALCHLTLVYLPAGMSSGEWTVEEEGTVCQDQIRAIVAKLSRVNSHLFSTTLMFTLLRNSCENIFYLVCYFSAQSIRISDPAPGN